MPEADASAAMASFGARSRVRSASVAGEVLENSRTRLPPALEVRIEVLFEDPALRLALGPLHPSMRRWTDLADTEWRPPATTTTRMVEGEEQQLRPSGGGFVERGEERVALALERIRFGAVTAETVEATIVVRLDLDRGARTEELTLTLSVGPIRILGDLLTKPRPDLDSALRLAAEFLDLDAFEPRVERGVVELHPH